MMSKSLYALCLFMIIFTLTGCGQKVANEETLSSEAKGNEGFTTENTEQHSAEESAAILYWRTLLNELYWGENRQLNKSIQVELYLNSIAEEQYGSCLSYIDDMVYLSEIHAQDKKYGKYVCGEGGIYDADFDYAQQLIDQARTSNVFSVVGTVTTNVSDTLNELIKENEVEESVLFDLVTVCIQYICDEYIGSNGDIEGKIDAQFHLTDISISDNRLSGSGWLSLSGQSALEVTMSLKLDSHQDDHQHYDYNIVTGNIADGEKTESLFSVECGLQTECN